MTRFLKKEILTRFLEQEPDHNEIDFFRIFDNNMDMANNFVEEEFQTIERDDLNEAFYGGTQQEAVIAEVIDGHKLIDLENVVFGW